MLRIYRTEEDGRLTKLKKNKILPMTWCSLVNPNEEELLQVSTVLHVDYDLLSNSLDADEPVSYTHLTLPTIRLV